MSPATGIRYSERIREACAAIACGEYTDLALGVLVEEELVSIARSPGAILILLTGEGREVAREARQ